MFRFMESFCVAKIPSAFWGWGLELQLYKRRAVFLACVCESSKIVFFSSLMKFFHTKYFQSPIRIPCLLVQGQAVACPCLVLHQFFVCTMRTNLPKLGQNLSCTLLSQLKASHLLQIFQATTREKTKTKFLPMIYKHFKHFYNV